MNSLAGLQSESLYKKCRDLIAVIIIKWQYTPLMQVVHLMPSGVLSSGMKLLLVMIVV